MAFSTTRVTIGHTTKKSDADRLMDNTIALASADIDIHGEKTFHSSTVFKMSTTHSGTVSFEDTATHLNRPRLDGIKSRTSTSGVDMEVTKILQSGTATVVTMTLKILEIGDWDMAATQGVHVTHGLDHTKIRSVQAMIRNDNHFVTKPVAFSGKTEGDVDIEIETLTSTVHIERLEGGSFDGISFNDTSYNRGWITIWYEI